MDFYYAHTVLFFITGVIMLQAHGTYKTCKGTTTEQDENINNSKPPLSFMMYLADTRTLCD